MNIREGGWLIGRMQLVENETLAAHCDANYLVYKIYLMLKYVDQSLITNSELGCRINHDYSTIA